MALNTPRVASAKQPNYGVPLAIGLGRPEGTLYATGCAQNDPNGALNRPCVNVEGGLRARALPY
eukprot:312464-Lingulodinium_polyedra.AAC.1